MKENRSRVENPFEKKENEKQESIGREQNVSDTRNGNKEELSGEAEAEQQRKEALTERD